MLLKIGHNYTIVRMDFIFLLPMKCWWLTTEDSLVLSPPGRLIKDNENF